MANLFAEKLTRALDNPSKLPTFPAVAAEIMALLDDPNAGLSDIAKVAAKDPVLAARMMRLAASAMFASASVPDTVLAAVSRIGQRGVRDVVLLEGMRRTFPPTRKFDHKAFWKHSLAVGFMGELLASGLGVGKRLGGAAAGVFTAGLLHDIGLALYMTIDEISLMELLARKGEPGQSLEDIEREHLGLSHVDAGVALCHHWRLSEIVAASVAAHHDPSRLPLGPLRGMAELIHLADHLCAVGGLGDFGEQRSARFKWDTAPGLGLTTEKFPLILSSLGETSRRLLAFE